MSLRSGGFSCSGFSRVPLRASGCYLHRAREDANEVDVTVLVVFVIHPLGQSPPLCAGGVGVCCGMLWICSHAPFCSTL